VRASEQNPPVSCTYVAVDGSIECAPVPACRSNGAIICGNWDVLFGRGDGNDSDVYGIGGMWCPGLCGLSTCRHRLIATAGEHDCSHFDWIVCFLKECTRKRWIIN
jgi:hypothetical protein